MNGGKRAAAVAIITKLPRLGQTKTRLAAAVGPEAALALHRAFLRDQLEQLRCPRQWDLHLVHDKPHTPEEHRELAELLSPGVGSITPGASSLQAELLAGFQQLCARYARVIIVSADVPQITPEVVEEALAALGDHDLVLGAGPDGGYYLVGLSEPHDIFTPVPFSNTAVVHATRALASTLGLRTAQVRSLEDLDEAQDLLALDRVRSPWVARRSRAVVDGLERRPFAPALPTELQLEVTSRCNLSCAACLRARGPLAPNADLTLDDFRQVSSGLPRLERVSFQLNGEPLLCPDLFAMIREAKDRGAQTVVNTNGVLLDNRGASGLLMSGIDEIRLSLHGACAATHDRMVGAPVFDPVVANLRRLVELRGSRSAPWLSLWLIAMRDTIGELPMLVELGADIGVDGIYLQRLVTTGRGGATASQSLHARLDTRLLSVLRRAEAVASARGVALQASGRRSPAASLERDDAQNPWLGCWRPWRSATVTANLKVLPCCISSFRAPYAELELGDLRRQSWPEIWNGEPLRRLRDGILSGDPIPACRGCTTEYSL